MNTDELIAFLANGLDPVDAGRVRRESIGVLGLGVLLSLSFALGHVPSQPESARILTVAGILGS